MCGEVCHRIGLMIDRRTGPTALSRMRGKRTGGHVHPTLVQRALSIPGATRSPEGVESVVRGQVTRLVFAIGPAVTPGMPTVA